MCLHISLLLNEKSTSHERNRFSGLQEGNGYQQDRNESKYARSPINTKLMIHCMSCYQYVLGKRSFTRKGHLTWSYEKRERRSEDTTKESIGSNSTGRVVLKGVDKVVERSLEDGKEAEAHTRGSNTLPTICELMS